MGKLFSVFIAFALQTLWVSPVKACSCEGGPTVEGAFKQADAVWAGTVLSKEPVYVSEKEVENSPVSPDGLSIDYKPARKIVLMRYVLRVDTWYKGNSGSDTVTVYTGLGGGDCGLRFREGNRYIVYGEKESYYPSKKNIPPQSDTVFWTHSCTRTFLYSEKEEEAIRTYLEVQQMSDSAATFPVFEKGGEEGMRAFFGTQFIYPKDAHVAGKVYIKIRVSASGQLTKTEILRGLLPSIDEETLRVVNKMKFLPGTLNGTPVEMTLIISFKI